MELDDFLEELKAELLLLINQKYKKESTAIKKDVTAFIEKSREKLIRWTELLLAGKLTTEEYTLLIDSQKDLFVMQALYNAGVSAISLGHFKNKVISLILNKAMALLVAAK